VRLASSAGRWVLAVAVLGEAMVLLEATVVNVALPAIGRDLGAGVAGLQWVLDGYVLTLAALVLPAGSLSDLYGRRRMFIVGVAAFVAASALCAGAPTIQLLVAARFVQGVGGALLTPGSLAIIDAVFHPDDRTRAIGAWAGLTAVAAAVRPARRRLPDRCPVMARGLPDQRAGGGVRHRRRGGQGAGVPGPHACWRS
jgi:MFS family permease